MAGFSFVDFFVLVLINVVLVCFFFILKSIGFEFDFCLSLLEI